MINNKKIESEKLVERTLVNAVKDKGGLCLKLPAVYVIGLPDRLCLFPGEKAIFVELKTTGKKARKVQQYIHQKIRALGFTVLVIDSTKAVHDLCNQF